MTESFTEISKIAQGENKCCFTSLLLFYPLNPSISPAEKEQPGHQKILCFEFCCAQSFKSAKEKKAAK